MQNHASVESLLARIRTLEDLLEEKGKLNPHRMDKSKVCLLQKISSLNSKGFEWVKIQQDSALIKDSEKGRTIQCDAVHASRLKWFGLVDLLKHRSGEYQINKRGRLFLQGKYRVPSRIWCLKGVVVKREETEGVFIKDIRGVVLDKSYWDSYPSNEAKLF